jgi:hypothetical protein
MTDKKALIERLATTCHGLDPVDPLRLLVADVMAALRQPEQEPVAVYGYCPKCEAKGVMRERRPNGNDKCANGHIYPSSKATTPPQRTEQEMVMWPCLIDTADFSKGTVTVVMQCEDYKVSAGTHWLSTTSPKENT